MVRMRDLIGLIKDKASLPKLTLTSKPKTLHLHLAVLRATSHSPSTPPTDHHLATLLSLGDTSRATASVITHSLTHRLHRTHNSHVALKCLLTIHHVITRGPFILKDQFSIFPSTNGRNNLKLSNFRDGASAATWMLSVWVRWYARYIETVIFTSKNVNFAACSISSTVNSDLVREFGSLVGVIEEICKVPDNLTVERDRLLRCVMELLVKDYFTMVNEIVLRLSEFEERVELLSFSDSVELDSGLKRLMRCKERCLELFSARKMSVVRLWEMVEELNDKIGAQKLGRRMVGLSRLGWVTEL